MAIIVNQNPTPTLIPASQPSIVSVRQPAIVQSNPIQYQITPASLFSSSSVVSTPTYTSSVYGNTPVSDGLVIKTPTPVVYQGNVVSTKTSTGYVTSSGSGISGGMSSGVSSPTPSPIVTSIPQYSGIVSQPSSVVDVAQAQRLSAQNIPLSESQVLGQYNPSTGLIALSSTSPVQLGGAGFKAMTTPEIAKGRTLQEYLNPSTNQISAEWIGSQNPLLASKGAQVTGLFYNPEGASSAVGSAVAGGGGVLQPVGLASSGEYKWQPNLNVEQQREQQKFTNYLTSTGFQLVPISSGNLKLSPIEVGVTNTYGQQTQPNLGKISLAGDITNWRATTGASTGSSTISSPFQLSYQNTTLIPKAGKSTELLTPQLTETRLLLMGMGGMDLSQISSGGSVVNIPSTGLPLILNPPSQSTTQGIVGSSAYPSQIPLIGATLPPEAMGKFDEGVFAPFSGGKKTPEQTKEQIDKALETSLIPFWGVPLALSQVPAILNPYVGQYKTTEQIMYGAAKGNVIRNMLIFGGDITTGMGTLEMATETLYGSPISYPTPLYAAATGADIYLKAIGGANILASLAGAPIGAAVIESIASKEGIESISGASFVPSSLSLSSSQIANVGIDVAKTAVTQTVFSGVLRGGTALIESATSGKTVDIAQRLDIGNLISPSEVLSNVFSGIGASYLGTQAFFIAPTIPYLRQTGSLGQQVFSGAVGAGSFALGSTASQPYTTEFGERPVVATTLLGIGIGGVVGAVNWGLESKGIKPVAQETRVILASPSGDTMIEKITGFKVGLEPINTQSGVAQFNVKGIPLVFAPQWGIGEIPEGYTVLPTGTTETQIYRPDLLGLQAGTAKQFFTPTTLSKEEVMGRLAYKGLTPEESESFVKTVYETGGSFGGRVVGESAKLPTGEVLGNIAGARTPTQGDIDLMYPYNEAGAVLAGKKLGLQDFTKTSAPQEYLGYRQTTSFMSGELPLSIGGTVKVEMTIPSPSPFEPVPPTPLGQYMKAYSFTALEGMTVISPEQYVASKGQAVMLVRGEGNKRNQYLLAPVREGMEKYNPDVNLFRIAGNLKPFQTMTPMSQVLQGVEPQGLGLESIVSLRPSVFDIQAEAQGAGKMTSMGGKAITRPLGFGETLGMDATARETPLNAEQMLRFGGGQATRATTIRENIELGGGGEAFKLAEQTGGVSEYLRVPEGITTPEGSILRSLSMGGISSSQLPSSSLISGSLTTGSIVSSFVPQTISTISAFVPSVLPSSPYVIGVSPPPSTPPVPSVPSGGKKDGESDGGSKDDGSSGGSGGGSFSFSYVGGSSTSSTSSSSQTNIFNFGGAGLPFAILAPAMILPSGQSQTGGGQTAKGTFFATPAKVSDVLSTSFAAERAFGFTTPEKTMSSISGVANIPPAPMVLAKRTRVRRK